MDHLRIMQGRSFAFAKDTPKAQEGCGRGTRSVVNIRGFRAGFKYAQEEM